jgi:hypothetical protein
MVIREFVIRESNCNPENQIVILSEAKDLCIGLRMNRLEAAWLQPCH